MWKALDAPKSLTIGATLESGKKREDPLKYRREVSMHFWEEIEPELLKTLCGHRVRKPVPAAKVSGVCQTCLGKLAKRLARSVNKERV